jgi:hypothetical protein
VTALTAQVTALQTTVAAQQSQIAALQNQQHAVFALDPFVSVNPNGTRPDNGFFGDLPVD